MSGYGPADAYAPDSAARERTVLAWQRTALALIVAAAIVARLTIDDLGAAALWGGGLAALAAAAGLAAVDRRVPFRRFGGAPHLALALVVAGIGLLELRYVVSG